MSSDEGKVDVLMVGTGEYTTGYVGGAAADRYAIYVVPDDACVS